MKKSESLIEKAKAGSRKAFIGMGNMAVGNTPSDSNKRGNMSFAPFSASFLWLYETPMPKRKSK